MGIRRGLAYLEFRTSATRTRKHSGSIECRFREHSDDVRASVEELFQVVLERLQPRRKEYKDYYKTD